MNGRRVSWCVVGSGASAVGAISALNEAGIVPTVIDAEHLNSSPSLDHLPFRGRVKTYQGETFAYQIRRDDDHQIPPSTLARPSRSLGGFSRVWGGTFDASRYLSGCMKHIEFSNEDHSLVNRVVPIVNSSKIYSGSPGGGFSGHQDIMQIHKLLAATKSKGRICAKTIDLALSHSSGYGTALVSDSAEVKTHAVAWFAGDEIRRLENQSKIQLWRDQKVMAVREVDNEVTVTSVVGTRRVEHRFDHVVLAAGVIGTAEILLRSIPTTKVKAKETFTGFSGVLSLQSVSKGNSEADFAAFSIESERALLQVYPPYSGLKQELKRRFPRIPIIGEIGSALALHILPAVIYLQESESSGFQIQLTDNNRGVRLEHKEPDVRAMRNALRPINQEMLKKGLVIGTWLIDAPGAGSGFHFGSTFPLGESSDRYGRVGGFARVHIVDASVLPAIELGSITGITLLNAVRTVREVVQNQ